MQFLRSKLHGGTSRPGGEQPRLVFVHEYLPRTEESHFYEKQFDAPFNSLFTSKLEVD